MVAVKAAHDASAWYKLRPQLISGYGFIDDAFVADGGTGRRLRMTS